MTVLEFPKDVSDVTPAYFAYHQEASLTNSAYFPIRQMNGGAVSSTNFDLLSPASTIYNNLRYIDLDQSLEGESLPFIDSVMPFTIELKLTLHFDGADYFDKSRIFFSIGQYISGKPGGVITVGTNANDSANKKKPVIGFIDQYGVIKSLPISGSSIEIDDSASSKEYTFKLVFNPQTEGANRLLLFVSNDTVTEALQSNGEGLSINYNFNIAKPRLYLFTSGWTNEYGWNGSFDFAFGTLGTRDLKVYDDVVYSQDFLLNSLNNVQFETAELSHEEGIDVTSQYLSSQSTIEVYM